jgi:predicted short-subunit dehydrogenase-like oxidoreductase (DUF2520 family)
VLECTAFSDAAFLVFYEANMQDEAQGFSVSIVGAGAAGASAAAALFAARKTIDVIIDKDLSKAAAAARTVGASFSDKLSEDIAESDIVLAAVPDTQIEVCAAEAARLKVCLTHQVWLHLSGALPPSALDALKGKVAGLGAFHPARAFPQNRVTRILPDTCFGVDGDAVALRAARRLAEDLGGRAVRVPAEIRPLYHAACVLASNAVLGLVAEAKNILVSGGIDEDDAQSILLPLADGALKHAFEQGLAAALTGPIQRGDTQTAARHLTALQPMKNARDLYKASARAIVDLARTAGRTAPEKLSRIEALLNED